MTCCGLAQNKQISWLSAPTVYSLQYSRGLWLDYNAIFIVWFFVCTDFCLFVVPFCLGMLLGLCFSLAGLGQENLTHDLGKGERGQIMYASVIPSCISLETMTGITVHQCCFDAVTLVPAFRQRSAACRTFFYFYIWYTNKLALVFYSHLEFPYTHTPLKAGMLCPVFREPCWVDQGRISG